MNREDRINLSRMVGTLVIMGLLAGCTAAPAAPELSQPSPGTSAQSNKERVKSPDVAASDLADLAIGNSAFAFDLYRRLSQGDTNLFYSPYSISLALAMTYAGARGQTEQQMADTLHFTLGQEKLHSAFNWLDQQLARRGEDAEDRDGEGFKLNIANAIWGQQNHRFLADFLDVLAENYGAGLRGLDFVSQPEESRLIINQWVSDQTEGKIEDLIPPGAIDIWTRLVLTNAIYFNAAWEHQFDEDNTIDRPFYLPDGSQTSVPMMRQTKTFNYTEGDGYRAVELPYDGGELSMVIVVPDEGNFGAFEDSLDAQLVDDIIRDMESRRVSLAMPKFEFSSDFSLAETLAAMGMPAAFSDADFSGMTGAPGLFISDIIHKAFVSVDEYGTEAAAATAVIMPGAAPLETVTLNIDHPFIFLIRDIETGSMLFVGRVLNPNE